MISVERRREIAKSISEYCGLEFGVQIKGPLTLKQVEEESIKEIEQDRKDLRPDIPLVPYGFINDKWNELKGKYENGDELYYFKSDPMSWSGLYGREGHVLIRETRVIAMIFLSVS